MVCVVLSLAGGKKLADFLKVTNINNNFVLCLVEVICVSLIFLSVSLSHNVCLSLCFTL